MKTIPCLKNRRRMIVEIAKNTGRYYKPGDKHEVGCYITFGYGRGVPHFEQGKDKNGDGIAVEDCRVVQVLDKQKTPVKQHEWK